MSKAINKRYQSNLKKIERILGNKITNGEQLDGLSRRLFGGNYKGLYGEFDNFPHLDNNEFIIVNKPNNQHWISIFNRGGKMYEFDSFARDLMGGKYIDFNTRYDNIKEQKINELNCGARTVAMIMTLLHK